MGYFAPQGDANASEWHRDFLRSRCVPGSVTGASVGLVLTGGGEFKARLTWLKLRRLRGGRAAKSSRAFALSRGHGCGRVPVQLQAVANTRMSEARPG